MVRKARACALLPVHPGHLDGLPHAVGVAALIVAEYGKRDSANGGLTLAPDTVERILKRTATDTPCPARRRSPTRATARRVLHATCEGTPAFNGFYGDGIVDALAASKSLAVAAACYPVGGPQAPGGAARPSRPRRRGRQLRRVRVDP